VKQKTRNDQSVKKAATVILSLGVEYASQVFKYLRPEEIEMITMQIATLDNLPSPAVESTMEEFYNLCVAQKYLTEGGIEYARAILEKTMGAPGAAGIIDKITRSLQTKAFGFLGEADPKHILSLIQNEHPQTIALILSYCATDQAADVLSELPASLQLDVVSRIATMDSTSPDAIRDAERIIENKLSISESIGFAEIGGTKYMAGILNLVDRSTEKFIMDELFRRDPKLAEEIRDRMFVFEDIAQLEPVHIQRFLQDAESSDLIVAIKGCPKEIADVFYENMSTRQRQTLEEESKYMHGVKMSDVEEAQKKLVSLVRTLGESGEIVIDRGRKEDIIV
jgi:flagellar motor switch protein FliG